MDKHRYENISSSMELLSAEELKAGWHFCFHHGDRLIGPDTIKKGNCDCILPAKINYEDLLRVRRVRAAYKKCCPTCGQSLKDSQK